MEVTIEFYGGLKQLAGASEWTLTLEEGGSYRVRDVLERLFLALPELRGRLTSLAFALDDELVGEKHPLVDGDRLGLLPPVSGG